MDSKSLEEKKIEDLLEEMRHADASEKKMITKAFEFAKKAHKGQMRESGHPYFFHLFETAKILAEIGMGPKTVTAGLLHDVIEDTETTEDTIVEEFGEEILFLIQGVTKLGKLKYRGLKRHTESLRKFFIATSQDIRVLIIRLADRLHNMETLQYLSKEKQIRKSTEVLEIFSPLAYRLGMRVINKRLEDLAFSYLYPQEFKETQEALRKKKKKDLKFLEKFDKSLKKTLAKEGLTKIKTSFRVKGLYSLYKKIKKKDGIDNIYDITALRIVTDSISDCYKVLGIIHSTWKPLPGRLKDFIALPKVNGYQSIHTTIFTGDGGILEIQIRTQKMHDEAELGIASHISYKSKSQREAETGLWIMKLLPKLDIIRKAPEKTEKDQAEVMQTTPGWVKEIGDELNTKKKSADVLEEMKTDFFKNRVFVFTPTGDVLDLPAESTPIDFAYSIHSYVGNHISGAKVNSKMVSLDTALKNGDIVDIITKKSSKPNRKWLSLVKTTEAKRSIRSALRIPK